MSWKIWRAYKVRNPDNLAIVLRSITDKGRSNVTSIIRRWIDEIIQESAKQWADDITKYPDSVYLRIKQDLGRKEDFDLDKFTVLHWLAKKYREQVGSYERNLFDFTVSVSLHMLDGQWYMIPYCDGVMRKTLDFLEDMPELVDFHYQTSTDRAEGISDEEWAARGEMWERIFPQGGNRMSVSLDVVNSENFHAVVFDAIWQDNFDKVRRGELPVEELA